MQESKVSKSSGNKGHQCENTYSWCSDLYKRLEMRTYIDVIDKGVTVVNNTVGVGRHIIIKINKNFVKKDSPDGF